MVSLPTSRSTFDWCQPDSQIFEEDFDLWLFVFSNIHMWIVPWCWLMRVSCWLAFWEWILSSSGKISSPTAPKGTYRYPFQHIEEEYKVLALASVKTMASPVALWAYDYFFLISYSRVVITKMLFIRINLWNAYTWWCGCWIWSLNWIHSKNKNRIPTRPLQICYWNFSHNACFSHIPISPSYFNNIPFNFQNLLSCSHRGIPIWGTSTNKHLLVSRQILKCCCSRLRLLWSPTFLFSNFVLFVFVFSKPAFNK